MALGAALFSLGIFHGFAHGSCSTTGYSSHYGPVPHCASGTVWWMLLLTGGILVALGGAALSGMASTILVPVMFVAIGAPFVVLGLDAGDGQLVYGSSSSAGRLEVAIFGACFAIAGLVWGVIAGRKVLSRLRFSGLLASVAGVGVAFLIGTGVSSAIGSSPVTSLTQFTPSTASVAQSRAAATQTKRAACVTAVGIHNDRIQACERKYVP